MSESVQLNEVEELWVTSNYSARPPTPADLLAVVRRGVESGTIKGRVFSTQRPTSGPWLEPGTYLVIGPVSDGGSET